MGTAYPRDMIGYGARPPHPKWPAHARLALQFVINYEEGVMCCKEQCPPNISTPSGNEICMDHDAPERGPGIMPNGCETNTDGTKLGCTTQTCPHLYLVCLLDLFFAPVHVASPYERVETKSDELVGGLLAAVDSRESPRNCGPFI